MDDLDFAILRQLLHPRAFQWNVRLSFAQMGRATGADEETVRMRIRRLEDAGIIHGWQVVPSADLFGRTWVRYDLPPAAPDSRARLESALVAMDGAHLLMEHLGDRFALVTYQVRGPAVDRQAALIAAVAGAPPIVVPMDVAPAEVELSSLDWRIVRALRRNPRAAYTELADELAASERTLRRRVDRMIEGRALIHDVDVDFTRIEGAVVATLHVTFRSEGPRLAIIKVLDELPHIFRQLEGPRVRVTYAAANIPAAEALRRRVEDMGNGDVDVRIEFILRRLCLRGWLDDEIELRAR